MKKIIELFLMFALLVNANAFAASEIHICNKIKKFILSGEYKKY